MGTGKKSNTLTTKKKSAAETLIYWVPAGLVFCVLPFFLYYKAFESRLTRFDWASSSKWDTDFYLYNKQIFFFYISGLMAVLVFLLLLKLKKNGTFSELRSLWNMALPLGIYLLLALLSSLFSEYKWIAFTGSDGQFESFFALLGYVLCFFYFALLLRTESDFQIVERILDVFLAFAVIIGLFQITGHDLMDMEWFQRIITPRGYLESGAKIHSYFENNRVGLFSYNPNYAGVLLALSSAFCFGTLITGKKRGRTVAKLVLLVLLLVCLLGTGSKAGMLTFVAVCVFGLLFQRKRLVKVWYLAIPALAAVICCVFLVTHFNGTSLVNYLGNALKLEKNEPNPLQEMKTDEKGVQLKYNGVSFLVAFDYEDGDFYFNVQEKNLNENGRIVYSDIPLRYAEDSNTYTPERSALDGITLQAALLDETYPMAVIHMNGRDWHFVRYGSGDIRFINQYSRPEKLVEIKRFGFEGYERFATGRGLIWSMTLPLLPENFFIGSGVDTFVCVYPQNNYKDLYFYTGMASITSRPHSMYLKTAVETGMLSLIAQLVFFAWYLLQSLGVYWNCRFETKMEQVGFGCFLAVTVYLICGLTNDSMITVAPVFWGILGIGAAANQMIKKGIKEERKS